MPRDADKLTLRWDEQPGLIYHAYRDDVALVGYGYLGAPHDELIPGPAPNSLFDSSAPAAGQAWFYLVTAEDGAREGTLGNATCSERCAIAECHTPPAD